MCGQFFQAVQWRRALGLAQDILHWTHPHVELELGQFDHRKFGEPRHSGAIGAHKKPDGLPASLLLMPGLFTRQYQASRESLQVPLERPASRLIEIVDVENEMPVRSGVGAQITDMG